MGVKRLAYAFIGGILLTTGLSWSHEIQWTASRPEAKATRQKAELQIVMAEAEPFEKDGYIFRSTVWHKMIRPEEGRAIRIQLIAHQDYLMIASLNPEPRGALHVEVLDPDGNLVSKPLRKSSDERTHVIEVKAKTTGTYMILLRHDSQSQEWGAMVVGSK